MFKKCDLDRILEHWSGSSIDTIGLFCNITSIEKQSDGIGKKIYQNDESIIYNNSNLRKEVEVSLENYIIGICNIDGLYNKINIY